MFLTAERNPPRGCTWRAPAGLLLIPAQHKLPMAEGTSQEAEEEKTRKGHCTRGADAPDLNTTHKSHTAKPQAHPEPKQTLTSDPWAVMLLPCRQGEKFPSSFFIQGMTLWGQQPPQRHSTGMKQLSGRVRYSSHAPIPPLRHPQTSALHCLQDKQIPKSQCSCPGRGNNTKGCKRQVLRELAAPR